MTAESGTAEIDDADSLKNTHIAPEGWFASVDGISAIPDHTHPLFPDPRLEKIDPRLRAQLEDMPQLREAIAAFTQVWKSRVNELQRRLDLALDSEIDTDMEIFREQLAALIDRVRQEVSDIAQRHTPPGVSAANCSRYIIAQTFSEETVIGSAIVKTAGYLQPVVLTMNISDKPWTTLVRPGEIVMKFTGASQSERSLYDPLITKAQERFKHQKDPGKRPSRKDDSQKAEQLRTTAKLHHWMGWSANEIAAFMGWEGSPETKRERVRRALRDGEELLTSEIGVNWKVNPPDGLPEAK